jgi:hypothetical protein
MKANMGYGAKKTEHSGPKRGKGASYNVKAVAKKGSARIRRENGKREIRVAVKDDAADDRKSGR